MEVNATSHVSKTPKRFQTTVKNLQMTVTGLRKTVTVKSLRVISGPLALPMEDVAAANLEKIFSRMERGVLHGDGDSR